MQVSEQIGLYSVQAKDMASRQRFLKYGFLIRHFGQHKSPDPQYCLVLLLPSAQLSA
jgi:hypothetical protein